MHAQQGLRYLVCVSVTTFSATTCYNAQNKIYHRILWDMRKRLNLAFSLKMLYSGILTIINQSGHFSSTFEHAHTDMCMAMLVLHDFDIWQVPD